MVSKNKKIIQGSRFPEFIKTEGYYFIIFLLIISFFSYFASTGSINAPVTYTIINSDKKEIQVLRPRVGTMKVKGRLGDVIVEWRADGSVRIASSTCPLKICVSRGWIHGNDSVVCVPNEVVVTCHTDLKSNVDGVSR